MSKTKRRDEDDFKRELAGKKNSKERLAFHPIADLFPLMEGARTLTPWSRKSKHTACVSRSGSMRARFSTVVTDIALA
jgi:hypothetical protein